MKSVTVLPDPNAKKCACGNGTFEAYDVCRKCDPEKKQPPKSGFDKALWE